MPSVISYDQLMAKSTNVVDYRRSEDFKVIFGTDPIPITMNDLTPMLARNSLGDYFDVEWFGAKIVPTSALVTFRSRARTAKNAWNAIWTTAYNTLNSQLSGPWSSFQNNVITRDDYNAAYGVFTGQYFVKQSGYLDYRAAVLQAAIDLQAVDVAPITWVCARVQNGPIWRKWPKI